MEDLSTCNDLISKHGSALQRSESPQTATAHIPSRSSNWTSVQLAELLSCYFIVLWCVQCKSCTWRFVVLASAICPAFNTKWSSHFRSLSELDSLRLTGEANDKIRQVTERATLFRITSNAMINVRLWFISCYATPWSSWILHCE